MPSSYEQATLGQLMLAHDRAYARVQQLIPLPRVGAAVPEHLDAGQQEAVTAYTYLGQLVRDRRHLHTGVPSERRAG